MEDKQILEAIEKIQTNFENKIAEMKTNSISKEEFENEKLNYEKQLSDLNRLTVERNSTKGTFENENIEKNTFSNALKDLTKSKINNIVFSNAINETADSEGAYLVPDILANDILTQIDQFGLVSKYAKKIQMTSDTFKYPKVSADVTAYNPGELTAATTSMPTFAQVLFTSDDFITLVPMSNQSLRDSKYPLDALVIDSCKKAFNNKIDAQWVTRTEALGNSYSLTASATGTPAATLTGDNFADMIAVVETQNPYFIEGAAFYMSATVKNLARKMKDSNGNYIFQKASDGTETIFGYPIVVTNKLASSTNATSGKAVVVFTNLANTYAWGDRMNLDILFAKEGSAAGLSLLTNNASAIRCTKSGDGQYIYEEGVCVWKNK